MHKTVLSHTSERLIIGTGFRQRFFMLGFGASLAVLAGAGLLMVEGSLNLALFGPLLGALVLTGALGIYRAFSADNDVYDRQAGELARYAGNLLSTKRVAAHYPLRDLSRLESDETEPHEPRLYLRGASVEVDISAYDRAAVEAARAFLGLPTDGAD